MRPMNKPVLVAPISGEGADRALIKGRHRLLAQGTFDPAGSLSVAGEVPFKAETCGRVAASG